VDRPPPVRSDRRGRRILHKKYDHSRKTREVTQAAGVLQAELGEKIEIAGTATTGSGRNVVGDFLDADLIIDEITAHARGAVEIDRDVDTIFEIGGQDSKYISIANADPLDFDMNKVCAAGTGSFLHELANKHGINIVGEFQEIALSSETPIKLERCTGFMESDLVSYHQQVIDHLIAGPAISPNYLNRVVGKRDRPEGDVPGRPSRTSVGRRLREPSPFLIVPPQEVLGGLGRPACRSGCGWRAGAELSPGGDRHRWHTGRLLRGRQVHNQASQGLTSRPAERLGWRVRYEDEVEGPRKRTFGFRQRSGGARGPSGFRGRRWRWTAGRRWAARPLYHQTCSCGPNFERLDWPGCPRPPTPVRGGHRGEVAETCYPVKVLRSQGRVLEEDEYLFFPTIVTMPTPEPSPRLVPSPWCRAPYMVRAALGLPASGARSLHLKHDPERFA
jgi:hypothetical protein